MGAKSNPDRASFNESVADLYRNLYDLVYLRTHGFGDVAIGDSTDSRADRGWKVHNLLLDVVEELNPGSDAPPFSAPWRRYHLMLSRYVEGLGPDDVARELAISRRQFFREQKEALELVAGLLWRRLVEPESAGASPDDSDHDELSAPLEHAALLRAEAARVRRANLYAHVGDVVAGVLSIMGDVFDQQAIKLASMVPDSVPIVAVDPSLLRQTLLSALGYLAEQADGVSMRLLAQVQDSRVNLAIFSESPTRNCPTAGHGDSEELVALQELASLSRVDLSYRCSDGKLAGFDISLPIAQRTVLVLDDNRDVLELFTRYLESSHYRVVTSGQADDALALARDLHPDIIILDLMMPQRDGWDVLQVLLHQQETRDIPVIVCSVLKQKPLALSLGASAFLEKPVDKQTLLVTIRALS